MLTVLSKRSAAFWRQYLRISCSHSVRFCKYREHEWLVALLWIWNYKLHVSESQVTQVESGSLMMYE